MEMDLSVLGAGGGTVGCILWFIKRLIAQHEARLTAVEKKVEEKFDRLIEAVNEVRIAVVLAQHTQKDVERLSDEVGSLRDRVAEYRQGHERCMSCKNFT